ncbi:DUF1810 domain-containing protein [Mucilaginibacter terrenus]|uniref:DUF1810 domain-containing protein n=1 Tax=Mucilaginibacter terrenus TaxID=2482727 RepID=A0A3E2NXR8_9SPHI|nr:DUF1810 domain-containing protein [Mucilaginibacter terrenus]RFZ85711.1 DUF1810 domain-containing protein [Mucilaginibacter terrenus]
MGLERFIKAQERDYTKALAEIRNGRKRSHWMWYIFPQIAGLGYSEMARHYAITDLAEAGSYLAHPILGPRLVEISKVLLRLQGDDANAVFGSPDDIKLRSSMTLFSMAKGTDPVFEAVLEKYFDGKKDNATVDIAG